MTRTKLVKAWPLSDTIYPTTQSLHFWTGMLESLFNAIPQIDRASAELRIQGNKLEVWFTRTLVGTNLELDNLQIIAQALENARTAGLTGAEIRELLRSIGR